MKALVLGGVAPHIALIERLKARGYRVLLADYLDNPPARRFADEYIQVSTLDVAKVRGIVRDREVDVVMTICVDHANITMCTVAEDLGLPRPYSLDTALAATDKGLMKARMREHGIPTSDYRVVSNLDELPWGELPFPLVVKPSDNNGSKGVKRVDDEQSLRRDLATAIELSRSKTAIVEGFNEGREIQVDCIASGGVAHVLTMREKLKIPSREGFAMQVYGSVTPAEIPEALQDEYRAIAQRIADAFDLEHTPFFFQSITDGERISVLELSPRIGGGLSYKLIKDSVGVDMVDMAISSYLDETIEFAARPAGDILASTIVYAKDGVLSRITGAGELKAAGVIVDWDQSAAVGDKFGDYMDSRNRVGAYYSRASSYGELKAKTERAESELDVVDAGGRSIKVRGLYYR